MFPYRRDRISGKPRRSEEHTSELQSLRHLVCRLLLEKKKRRTPNTVLAVFRPTVSTTRTLSFFRKGSAWLGETVRRRTGSRMHRRTQAKSRVMSGFTNGEATSERRARRFDQSTQ